MPHFEAATREDLPQLFGTVLTPNIPGNHHNVLIMLSRFFALLIWGAVALSAAYWGLRWFGKGPSVPPGTAPATLEGTLKGDLSKLLSGPASAEPVQAAVPQTALAGRLQLLGVVAPRDAEGRTGVALMVFDGRPARAYRIGQVIEGDMVVQSIAQKQVQIGPQGGPSAMTLDLSGMPMASTGTLPETPGVAGQPGYVQAPSSQIIDPATLPPPQAGGGMAANPIEGADDSGPNADGVTAPAPQRIPPRVRRHGPPGHVQPTLVIPGQQTAM